MAVFNESLITMKTGVAPSQRDRFAGQPCAVELFLHYSDKRMSAGIVHWPDGSLKQLALIREDVGGGAGDWPRVFQSSSWTENAAAVIVDTSDDCLATLGVTLSRQGSGHVTHADLQQEVIPCIDWSKSLLGSAGPDYRIVLCGEISVDRVAIIAPIERKANTPFACGACWWPIGSLEFHAIEVWYHGDGTLSSVRHLAFAIAST
ncbi:hypothetical protein AB1Y20_020237 [Prymnesium parvum]|uniref:Uncharacterized protein n=1 Tax=Prymnesium parvum TaxID=97485 RepID=A0AB34JX15_PRYPA